MWLIFVNGDHIFIIKIDYSKTPKTFRKLNLSQAPYIVSMPKTNKQNLEIRSAKTPTKQKKIFKIFVKKLKKKIFFEKSFKISNKNFLRNF